jgi:hypothetical protein
MHMQLGHHVQQSSTGNEATRYPATPENIPRPLVLVPAAVFVLPLGDAEGTQQHTQW